MNHLAKRTRFIKALRRESTDCTPFWMMRQAGRYLPEYRKVREKAGDFLTLCKTPELACEVTLQPLRRFDLDAAIIFSDILTLPDAMGLGLHFIEGEGPCFAHPIASIKEIENLTIPDISMLDYVMQAIKLVVKELSSTEFNVPLIGFSGSPWTLATYMVEGKASRSFEKIKRLLATEPHALQQLLDKLTQLTINYLLAQIEAGVEVLQIFDTWGGILNTVEYHAFSLHYMTQIVKGIKTHYPTLPIILFTKGSREWLESMADSGCDAISIDWNTDLAQAKQRVGNRVALQGNLNPAILLTTPTEIKKAAKSILSVYNDAPGHIFNLGHGIEKETPISNVMALVEAIRS